MAEVSPQLDPVYVECIELEAKLLAVAWRKFRSLGCGSVDDILPGTGKTARGLAHDAIVKLLKSGKWRPGENGREIYGYALTILNSLFIDLLRSAGSKNTNVMDPAELDTLKPSSGVSVETQLMDAERIEQIKLRLGKDTDGKAYLDALLAGARTREEIASIMGKTQEEITKIQKRLQYKLRNMEDLFGD